MVYLLTTDSEKAMLICAKHGLRVAELGEGQAVIELVRPAGHRGYPLPGEFSRIAHRLVVDLMKAIPGADQSKMIYLDDRLSSAAELVSVDWGGEKELMALVKHGRILRKTRGGNIAETVVSRPNLKGDPPEYRSHIATKSYASTGDMGAWVRLYASRLSVPSSRTPSKPAGRPREAAREEIAFKEARQSFREKRSGPDRRRRRR